MIDSPFIFLLFVDVYRSERSHARIPSNYTIKPEAVIDCMTGAMKDLQNRKDLEKEIFEYQQSRRDQSPYSYHQRVTTLSSEFRNMSDSAVVAESCVRLMMAQDNVPINELQSVDASPLLQEWVHCREEKVNSHCSVASKFRSLDGSCNNVAKPKQGASLQPFRRILPPVYDDGYSSPRTRSVAERQALPSAREVSRRFTDSAAPVAIENKLSMLFLTWGQFLDHDMTNTGSTKGKRYSHGIFLTA